MKSEKETKTMYDLIPAVAELNKVEGFDPLRFVQHTSSGVELPVKVKKLWFRLKYPEGRISVGLLKVTQEAVFVKARVYFNKNDAEPAAEFTTHEIEKDYPHGNYIEAAQLTAVSQALSDAGFGLQFLPLKVNNQDNTPTISEQEKEKILPVTAVSHTDDTESASEQSAIDEKVRPVPESAEAPQIHQDVNQAISLLKSPTKESKAEQEKQPAESAAPSKEPSVEFPPEMTVSEIVSLMSVEQAENYTVTEGNCTGLKMSEVAERHPAVLKYYVYGYKGSDNVMRAAAKVLLDIALKEKAS